MRGELTALLSFAPAPKPRVKATRPSGSVMPAALAAAAISGTASDMMAIKTLRQWNIVGGRVGASRVAGWLCSRALRAAAAAGTPSKHLRHRKQLCCVWTPRGGKFCRRKGAWHQNSTKHPARRRRPSQTTVHEKRLGVKQQQQQRFRVNAPTTTRGFGGTRPSNRHSLIARHQRDSHDPWACCRER